MPSSTCGSSASCCARLKRWISSTSRIVRWFATWRRRCAPATTLRMSATPAITALIVSKCDFVPRAMTAARLVLPVPGGPQRISEESRSASMARRRSWPGPTISSWPKYSVERARAHPGGERLVPVPRAAEEVEELPLPPRFHAGERGFRLVNHACVAP